MNASELKVGDGVFSPIGNRGKVTSIVRGAVTCAFHEKRQSWQTTYTPQWFAKWAPLLTRAHDWPTRDRS